MDNLIRINDKLFIDLNNYYEKIDETEDLNIFDENHDAYFVNNRNNAEISQKMEIKRYVNIFVDLLKDKNINYDTFKEFNDNNLDIIKTVQAINNSYIKNEEFHFTRLMMIICLKNYVFEYVNKYLNNIIKNYEKNKYKKEVTDFSSLIHSKENEKGELNNDTRCSSYGEKEERENSQLVETKQIFIAFLSKGITENSILLGNVEDNAKHLKEEEWTYLKEKILLLIKNSCVINGSGSNNVTNFVEFINNNMYKSFKRYKSIIEMKKFNICLYFIDIFFNIFLIDYPYKWGNLIGNIFDTFKFISIIKTNDFASVLNSDYNSTIKYIMDLIKRIGFVNEMENMEHMENTEKKNYSMVIHFQHFYSLMFLMNKILKKYIPRTQDRNSYSVLYHNYFISYINSDNKNLLEIEDYGTLKIPCENLLLGFKDIIKIFFPFFNRLLYYLLNFTNNIYIIFIIKKIVKFLYKTLLCHFGTFPEEEMNNELEILFTNIMKIIDINLFEYVNSLYFTNLSESSNKTLISVSKVTEESSYENLCEIIHNRKNDLDKLFLINILKAKKWCLKILNVFLYRFVHLEEMNDTWKLLLSCFENKIIIFLEKISVLILKIIINTIYTDEERTNCNKLFCYIRYVIDFTDYLKFADKCMSLALNYLCMTVSFDQLQVFVKQNILSEIFLSCLFIHIHSSSHIESVDNFFTNGPTQKEESLLFDNIKFEKYIICFQKIPLYRKYLLDYYDDTKSKNVLKKYANYIIFLFCELLEKYFYDVIFYLDKNVKDHLRNCLVIQNEYMHLLYPEMFIKEEVDFSNDVIEIYCYKKSNFLINAEMCMRTRNHNIYINNIIHHISEIIKNHMKVNDIQYDFDFSQVYLLNSDTFNNLIFVIKNLPLYKYSQEELLFKDLYSKKNEHNLNFSCIIMNDINLYKYFSLFMFLTYYKYLFVKRVLENVIKGDIPLEQEDGTYSEREDKEEFLIDDYIDEYCKNRKNYVSHFCVDDKEVMQFDSIVNDFKLNDKSFFLNHMLVNIFHPYSNSLKRATMWILKEYINLTRFSENALQFFFYVCFINLFYFEKHLKFKSFDTLVNLMYKFGIPREIFYNDFREIFTFLFFQLLILFIKNESTLCDNAFYEDNIRVTLSENYEKAYLLNCLRTEIVDFQHVMDKTRVCKSYLYNQINCFTDFFINDVLYNNFQFYMEKMEESNLNQFLNFISLYYQNEINNNIFLFINLLNESLLDISPSLGRVKDKEITFLRSLKFLSFFLEHYKNTCSTQDVLIIKILQNKNFIVYFKNIITRVNRNQLNEDILNEIYYVLYIFTKNSIFNYKIFWFYFLYSVACISNDLNIFHLKETNKLEKVPNIPLYVFQFFSNVIRRDVFYIFFSVAEEKPFSTNNSNISLIEILRKISLLLIFLSDENLNEQNFCNNSTLHICGLYFYNNLLSHLFTLLTKTKISYTYLFWKRLRKSFDLIQDDDVELNDIDDVVSNYSFKKYDEANSANLNFNSKEFVFLDDEFLNENIPDAEEDADMEDDPDLDVGEGVYVDIEEEEENEKGFCNSDGSNVPIISMNGRGLHIDDSSHVVNFCKSRKSFSSDVSFEKRELNDIITNDGNTEAEKKKSEILFYRDLQNYFDNKKKNTSKRKKNLGDCYNGNAGNKGAEGTVCRGNGSSDGNSGSDCGKENKIAKLLNTIYFNVLLLKDKKEEHIKKMLKSLKLMNNNLLLDDSENGYNLQRMLLMIQKKRYIYQSFSMYLFVDIQGFFNILVNENIFLSIIDEWLNDIFYIYQNSDDLKYFIFAFSNVLIYICMYERKRKMSSNKPDGINDDEEEEEDEKVFSFLKGDINSMNNYDKILREIDLEHFNVNAMEKLKQRLHKIINAIVNVVLILPIPYEDDLKVFNKNLLRRLAPICGEGDNIENNSLLKLTSENSVNDNRSSYFKEVHFNDLLQNIEFMHLNNYEQKFYERSHNAFKPSYNSVVHINKSEDLTLYDRKISINYYFQNSANDDFINRLISECIGEHFKVALYARKAFSLLTQEMCTNEDLINMIGCSDKYYNFINVIRLDM
ncbi:conserved Plasmodium protein, unknown function [Plasmodium ovale]|uniref:Uncharacterized protein n=1 Tax=Plasmodium ovale TaxID=36330 RepID=A0A1D3TIT7_PLAOA|nr:conserved Plasmodium protein, unknown function [Plasmodium ovale]